MVWMVWMVWMDGGASFFFWYCGGVNAEHGRGCSGVGLS